MKARIGWFLGISVGVIIGAAFLARADDDFPGMTLPSGKYMNDDVQYFPANPVEAEGKKNADGEDDNKVKATTPTIDLTALTDHKIAVVVRQPGKEAVRAKLSVAEDGSLTIESRDGTIFSCKSLTLSLKGMVSTKGSDKGRGEEPALPR